MLFQLMNSISRCSLQSSRASTPKDLRKLEEASVALNAILSLWQQKSPLPLRRKLNLEGRPPKVEKQLRGQTSVKKFIRMEKVSVVGSGFVNVCSRSLRISRRFQRSVASGLKEKEKKKVAILYPEFILDNEVRVYSICELVEPDGDDDVLLFQCNNDDCRVWVHVDCVEVRECAFCETGIYQATGTDEADV